MKTLERISNNIQKYAWLVGAFALATWLGSLWMGLELTLWILGIGGVITAFSMSRVPTQLLRWQGASKLDRYQYGQLYDMVNELARKASLTVFPDLYLLKSNQPNAFAMGTKKQPIIGLSIGLINNLSRRELQGVIAHEISHIKNNDLFVKGMARSFGNLTNTLSWVAKFLLIFAIPMFIFGMNIPIWPLLLLAFMPTINYLLQQGLSRSMEFLADHDAADLTKDPLGLASALHKIENLSRPWWSQFNPVAYRSNDWLSSHPNTKKRIEKLKDLSAFYPIYAEPVQRPVQRRIRPLVYRNPFGWGV